MKLCMTLKTQCLDTVVAANRQADAFSDLTSALATDLAVAPVAGIGPEWRQMAQQMRTLSTRRSELLTGWQSYEA